MDDLKEKEIDEAIEKKVSVPDKIFKKSKPEEPHKEEVSRTELIVKELHDKGLIEFVEENVEVQERIMKQVDRSIDMELSKIDSKAKKEAQDADYDANSEACKNYGVNRAVEQWKIKMMRIGSSFWFIVWFIVATLTFAPVSVFARGINTFLKRNWLSIVFAIIVYLFFTVGLFLFKKYNII